MIAGVYRQKKSCFLFFLSKNRSMLARSGSVVTFKCLYNAASLSRFTFRFSPKTDVVSVVPESVNAVSCVMHVFNVLQSS